MTERTGYTASSKDSRHKIALVIGNSDYHAGSSLKNTTNDANEMAKLLKKIGFKIQGDKAQLNLGYRDMKHILVDFQDSIKKEYMVLFYYAGHGIQWENRNYLIPIDNSTENNVPLGGSDLRGRAINAENILDEINDRHPFAAFFFLDCCRTYDLRNDDSRNSKRRDLPQHSHGLISMPARVGSLIAFACAPGTTADDGRNGETHGLFTKYLLEHLKTPNEDIEKLLRRVRSDVLEESNNEQIPHVTSLLTYDHICLFEQEGSYQSSRPSAETAASASKNMIVSPKSTRKINQSQRTDQKIQEFAEPGTCEKLYCKGRPCAKCHKCRDWHFSGDQKIWNWVCNYENWGDADKKLWYDGRYKLFTKRDGATCGGFFFDIIFFIIGHVCLCEMH